MSATARDLQQPELLAPSVVEYPESDGKPMAESDLQYRCIVDTRFGLEQHYRDRDDVYVGADLLVYYEEGDPSLRVAPDVLVALGVPKAARRSYLVWKEGKAPDVVFEIASPATWRADLTWKRGLYLGMGVREYIVYDPSGERIRPGPALRAFRLADEQYVPVAALPDGSGRGVSGIVSTVLGLEVWQMPYDPDRASYPLRLFDPAAAAWLPTPEGEAAARRAAEAAREDEAAARRAAEAAREHEAAARRAAEDRAGELEAELRRLRGRA